MAAQLKLVKLNDFVADVDTVDLLTGGFSLAVNGYMPAVASIGARSVHESITLNIQGTTTDDLALMVQDIDRKIKEVQWWLDSPGVERYQVWLRVQMEGETYARQAQILNIEPADKVEEFPDTENADHYIRAYTFGIERTPFWEQPYSYPSTTDKTGINCIGGSVALSETINGDVPARIAKLTLTPESTTYNTFWIGWRTTRFGTPANFVPVWSLSDGNTAGKDTSEVVDSSAYNGAFARCDFSTDATLLQRAWVRLNQAAPSNPSDQRGTFTVLLRAKMTDSSLARLRMVAGWLDTSGTTTEGTAGVINSPIYRNRVPISGTAWKLYEVGTISIPPLSQYNSSVTLENFTLSVRAERISGSGSLDMDCFVLIPRDEGEIRVQSVSDARTTSNPADYLAIITPANMQTYAYKFASSYGIAASYDAANVSPADEWSLPANNVAPRLIGAAQATTGNTKGDLFTMSYNYIPRWRTLRGSGAYGT